MNLSFYNCSKKCSKNEVHPFSASAQPPSILISYFYKDKCNFFSTLTSYVHNYLCIILITNYYMVFIKFEMYVICQFSSHLLVIMFPISEIKMSDLIWKQTKN